MTARSTNRNIRLICIVAFGTALAASQGFADGTAPLQQFDAQTPYDSGWISNDADETRIVADHTVTVPGAAWLRLSFASLKLGAAPGGQSHAYLRLTSVLDDAEQILTPASAKQWKLTSAYFNGDSVRIELIAPPQCAASRIQIETTTASQSLTGALRNLCDNTDDRLPTMDAKVARFLPVGCTAWLIDDANTCLLSAGHCVAGGDGDVVQFNVPLSDENGSLVHPPPSDQYIVADSSMQTNIGAIELGNDWTYFGVMPNSTTGLFPFEAQNDRFILELPVPATGQILRKTGCGTTGATVPGTYNQTTKTTIGPYLNFSGTILRFALDSSGGDSGSPVFYDGTNIAFCIHTNGGCSTTGYNSACGLNNVDLQAALANPIGICYPDFFDFEYPNGLPDIVNPDGGTRVRVVVIGRNGHEVGAAGGTLHYDIGDGNGFQTAAIEEIGSGMYDIVFPPIPCATLVNYYVTFENAESDFSADPLLAPELFHRTVSGKGINTAASYNFEATDGWFVTNSSVADGGWQRGVPVGVGAFGEPGEDFDGSGSCWLTGNNDQSQDLDGGPTRLWSPFIDATGMENPTIRYASWFTNSNNDGDALQVELANNSSVVFSTIETITDRDGWHESIVFAKDLFATPQMLRLRFSASDNPNNSRTEAGVDAVSLVDILCETFVCTKADVNHDGIVNGDDIAPFTSTILLPPDPESTAFCAADVNDDNQLDVMTDLTIFVDCVLSGGCQ